MSVLSGLRHAVASLTRRRGQAIAFGVLFRKFRSILERNNRILELMADMGDKLGGDYVFDRQYIHAACEDLGELVFKLVSDLSVLTRRRNDELFAAVTRIQHDIGEELAGRHAFPEVGLTLALPAVSSDLSEAAGNKMAVIGDVRNILGLAAPDGFVVSGKAFLCFMAQGGLPEVVSRWLAGFDGRDQDYLERMAADVGDRILAAELPRPLSGHIQASLDILANRHKPGRLRFAVRSSAWGEDSESSFAGQYATVLNVAPDEVFAAYKEVLASAYSAQAWRYRLDRGYREHEMIMAVGVQLMVEAEASGGLYTMAPVGGEREVMVVNAAWGLGGPVVDGTGEADTFVLSRSAPYAVTSSEIAHKTRALAPGPASGTELVPVPLELRDAPSLTLSQLERLAQAAMTLERYYKRPQDVEWSIAKDGTLYILQSRPLNLRSRLPGHAACPETATRGAEVVFAGKGQVAQRGVAVGKVFVVASDADLERFPSGAILVSHCTSPRFAKVMREAQGIITDVGSVTGHMATIAREYRVPCVVNSGLATGLLKTGDEITLDATLNAVYRGTLPELSRFELTEVEVFEDAYEYRLLRRVLKRVTPLALVDPQAENFRPASCRTYHDLTRYIHEKAVEELIDLSRKGDAYHGATPRRLATGLPLGLVMIDVDGGLAPGEGEAAMDDVRSVPMRAFIEGLTASNMWSTEPVSVDLKSFMSSFTRPFAAAGRPDTVGRNLAVISSAYANLNLRLGYHFSTIDAFISETVNDNSIYFRFLGGVTDLARRSRRARCIARILEESDFRVEVRGDLVVGRVKKLPMDLMIAKMRLLGGLAGYTRQLDVHMGCDADIKRHADAFMRGIAPVMEENREHHA